MKEHIVYYQRLLEQDPSNVEARLRLGALWRSAGRKDFAVPQYAAAARQLAKEGFLLEAIAACKAIFEMEPSHTETQLFLASLYARQPLGGAVARVVEPPAPASVDEDELIVLGPSHAVQELGEDELEASILTSAEANTLSRGAEADELDVLRTAELAPLKREARVEEPAEATQLAPGGWELEGAEPPLEERTTIERPLPQLPTAPPRGVSINYPDRVLRRALNLSMGWDGARSGSNPSGVESHDAWPRRAPDTGARPAPKAPRPRQLGATSPTSAHTEETRVASIFTENTVVGASGGVPASAPPSVAGSEEPGSTRVERPNPGAPPPPGIAPRPAPTASSPSYERIEVISPAALSVTRRDVPDTPLFSRLTPQSFMGLLRRIDLRRVPAGEAIIDDINRPLGLFIIVNGQVEVSRRLSDGASKFLARMGRGEFFGEFELLTGRSHSAMVRAVDAVDLLHVSDEVIADLADNDPTIWDVLWDFYHQRLLNNLLATSDIFRWLEPSERAALAKRFQQRFVDRGEVVIRRGERSAGLYLILNGAVEVLSPDEGPPVARLRDGDFFGTVSSATDQPARTTLRAAEDCTLLVLDRPALQGVLSAHPEAREALHRLAESRQVIVGKTGYSRIGMPK